MRALIVGALLVAWCGTLHAQIPPERQPQPQQQQPRDTVPVPQFRYDPPVSPLGAMWRSLLLPGWGQSILGRRATGAAFLFFEGLTATMTLKSAHQVAFQERTDAESLEDKRQELQDWAVLWGFNHLLAAAEAFVAAQLWDFPGELEHRSWPDGRLGLGVRIPF